MQYYLIVYTHVTIYIPIFAEEKALEGYGCVGVSLGGQDNITVMLGKDSGTRLSSNPDCGIFQLYKPMHFNLVCTSLFSFVMGRTVPASWGYYEE